jgi:hypothetical protein
MSENFSKSFESAFRVIFIIWVCFWGFVNGSRLIVQYSSFNTIEPTSNELGYWWLTTMATIVSVSIGVFLLVFMANVPNLIIKKRKIINIGLMTALSAFYYLFATIINTIAIAIFRESDFVRQFIFLSAWLFPSIILLIVHIMYFNNLTKYNLELEEKPQV